MATVAVKCRLCGLTDAVKKHGTGNGGPPVITVRAVAVPFI
ncbi:hypothetical protein [Providencia alcalifaciens]|nr:hypothetical protein [Providencia alcalifaciens]